MSNGSKYFLRFIFLCYLLQILYICQPLASLFTDEKIYFRLFLLEKTTAARCSCLASLLRYITDSLFLSRCTFFVSLFSRAGDSSSGANRQLKGTRERKRKAICSEFVQSKFHFGLQSLHFGYFSRVTLTITIL